MSTQYKKPSEVPTDTLIIRVENLADAVTKGESGKDEFTMRIPAECDRDADIVLTEFARRFKELEKQLAKANESALFYKEQYEKTDRECTKLAMRESKANERVKRLEKILQRYESEQLQPLKLRVKELEKERDHNQRMYNSLLGDLSAGYGELSISECEKHLNKFAIENQVKGAKALIYAFPLNASDQMKEWVEQLRKEIENA